MDACRSCHAWNPFDTWTFLQFYSFSLSTQPLPSHNDDLIDIWLSVRVRAAIDGQSGYVMRWSRLTKGSIWNFVFSYRATQQLTSQSADLIRVWSNVRLRPRTDGHRQVVSCMESVQHKEVSTILYFPTQPLSRSFHITLILFMFGHVGDSE